MCAGPYHIDTSIVLLVGRGGGGGEREAWQPSSSIPGKPKKVCVAISFCPSQFPTNNALQPHTHNPKPLAHKVISLSLVPIIFPASPKTGFALTQSRPSPPDWLPIYLHFVTPPAYTRHSPTNHTHRPQGTGQNKASAAIVGCRRASSCLQNPSVPFLLASHLPASADTTTSPPPSFKKQTSPILLCKRLTAFFWLH